MAKRRSKSAPIAREVFEWSGKEAAATLAYIDRCIEMGKSRKFIETTVADHLKSKWSRDYTWRRVENRLRIIHRRAHRPENKSRGDMMSKGTTCLDLENLHKYMLPHELTVDDIRTAKADLNIRAPPHDRRETDIIATRVSTRLSATPGYLELRCSAARSPVIRGSQRTSTVRGASIRSSDGNQPISATATKRKPVAQAIFISKSRRRTMTRPTATIDNTEIPDSTDASEAASTSRNASDVSPRLSCVKTENLLSFANRRASTSGSRRETGQVNGKAIADDDRQFSETTAALMNHQAIVDELRAINFTLKNQLAASEKRLEDNLKIWNSTTKQNTDGRALADSRRQLKKATDEITMLKTMLTFRTDEDLNMAPTNPKLPDIQKKLDYITSRAKMTFDFNKALSFDIPSQIRPNSETERLLRLAFSEEEGTNSGILLNLAAGKDVKPLNLVRAMMSAALRQWIFEADWPKFDHRPCIKLHGYREYMSLQEGVKRAQDIDFGVDQLLMQTPAFNDDLSTRVSDITDRLVKAVAPFFVFNPGHEIRTLSDVLSIEYAEIEAFVRRALEFKSDLLASQYSYCLVTFQSGSAFDPKTMRIETENGSPVAEPAKHPAIIELCLSPALFQGPDQRGASEEKQSQVIEFGEACFNHNNFVQEILGDRELVTKAVVLLEK